ncbi:hypothetical protein [Belnapia moabensis]|uniref:hypothetical protein n=1 Tax=Belnapia moabensis TaxID=365533 RepID=UPI0005BADD66|nr:hypothetical protein [Belnapia moabensis]
MRTPITLRLNADLLASARVEAQRDSRTLTNFIEVALKKHLGQIGATELSAAPGEPSSAVANVVGGTVDNPEEDLR